MADTEFDREWDRRITEIRKRAESRLPKGALVKYCAYEEDGEGMPVDNLDKVAVQGRCRFVQKHDPFYGDGRDYESAELLDPTWVEVCRLANEMIRVTGDDHHVFFEGVTVLREENGVKIVDLDMGS